ncbi:hypothetical protein R9C00_04780 [Flammeovirgaceae bacterium SG7u.111]|nr:hypothetical protein [Flammeovirgaceae bacterium SG7u.132]WPO36758.1 hypothetical protein R9C00_04780 [Flammeovirgaceae bacterium SG7u.111]
MPCWHTDHLGSPTVITDENGAVTEELGFDTWGKRREPNTWGELSGDVSNKFARGYTAHEHHELFCTRYNTYKSEILWYSWFYKTIKYLFPTSYKRV